VTPPLLDQTATVTIATGSATRLLIAGREAPISSRKSMAMLVYIALQPDQVETRERLAARLWSESGPDQARAALRQSLRRLIQDLGPAGDLVEADRTLIRLTRPVRLDLVEAQHEADRGIAPRLLAEQGADLGRVFADFEDIDSEFNLWITVQRERLVAQLIARLEAALAAASTEIESLAFAEALARVDPTHEGACRAAMQAHMSLGDTAQAMRCYERLWHVLEEDLDVEPSEKTQSLYVAIKQGRIQPGLPAPPAPAPPEELLAPIAIVVEPAQAVDLPGGSAYFGTIFRDEMIGSLARFRDWLVIDGEHVTGTPPAYRAYFLRISLHGRDDAILVTLRLVDQADGRLIWSERQTATLDGMPALHRTALRNLAVALNVHLSGPRLQSAREIASPMGRRYELWMQAQALMGDWRAESDNRAETILRDLVATNPSFAPAMVALAQSLHARPSVSPGQRRTPAHHAESLELTSRAVNLDPLDSRTHLCRAWSHAIAGTHAAALSHLDLALDLNENDPWTIISAALGDAYAGEDERARDLVAQAASLGMRYSRAAQGYVATASYLVGDYAGAVAAAEVAGDAIINLPAWQAASLVQLGDLAGAGRAIDRFLALATAGWTGPAPSGPTEVIDWFMGCFPIRSDRAREELRSTLLRALAAR
jgi:DNA-binding SARP family transcriptional activator/TolB-like protein